MNIEGKTVAKVTRHPDTSALAIRFTDGSGVELEVDSFRIVNMVTLAPIGMLPPTAARQPGLPASALNTQVGGDHYKKFGTHQPWEVLATWMTPEELKGAMKKDVIGYLSREADKGGRQDIEKAKHTLEIYLELSK